MGTCLHAIVEVFHPGELGVRRASWEDVATWEFNKDYPLMTALSDAKGAPWGWQGRSSHELDDLSHAAREIAEDEIGEVKQAFTLDGLRIVALYLPAGDRSPRFVALLVAVEVLARGALKGLPWPKHLQVENYYGDDCVRVLFYRT